MRESRRYPPDAIVQCIQTKEEAGLVRREPDPVDGRATAVVLTDAGAETVEASGRQAAEELAKLLSRLDDAERALVLQAGAVLARVTDDL